MEFIQEKTSVWERLQQERRPIALYGMGDGADKILRVFVDKGIKASTVFASDEFVRGHSFAGFRVQKLSEVVEQYGEDIVIVLSFASQRPELLERFYELDARFDLVAPDVPVAGSGLFDLDFVHAHADEFQRAYDWMADETARQVFSDIVNFKISGKIDYLRRCETDKDEMFRNILKPHGHECFADLGAYNGDTIRELLSYTDGAYDSITALEPDKRNFKKLSRYAEESLTGKVELVQAGGWSEDTVLTFAAKAGRNSALAKQGIPTQMRSLDSVLDGAPCTMLKLDVEGAEHQALLGAQQTIKTHHPRLNVACYHRNEDLFDLPALLKELDSSYKLYLRHHPYVPAWDVNLYAV
ncbi:methyltransferase [Butyricicoccus pullicaecorum]|uniref:Methyltransferase n=1 Tax=Butyricicoccus pullicaecorum TaxID=501571 RepID=A0A1Y4L9L1_9FIRM|nr:FkbM family methyltransferase [Butyricicoccus pullicaecorum]OUP52169.1 methyltransferase [Butyricicoccus pullicaecorum]